MQDRPKITSRDLARTCGKGWIEMPPLTSDSAVWGILGHVSHNVLTFFSLIGWPGQGPWVDIIGPVARAIGPC